MPNKIEQANRVQVERGVRWRLVEDHPLCKKSDTFEILIEGHFLAEIPIRSSKHSATPDRIWSEYYIVLIDDDGDLQDMSGNDLGMDWTAVSKWIPLVDILPT